MSWIFDTERQPGHEIALSCWDLMPILCAHLVLRAGTRLIVTQAARLHARPHHLRKAWQPKGAAHAAVLVLSKHVG